MTYSYSEGLRQYEARSDEKKVLTDAIAKRIEQNNVESLLDIGAGLGSLASMIATHVKRYVAVEKRKRNAYSLHNRGLNVVQKEFPFESDEKFDMVLASHSVPMGKKGVQDFVEGLVAAAKPDGLVTVITYKTDKDVWYELMRDAIGENWHGKNYDTYEMLFDVLKQHGDVHLEKAIRTAVRADKAAKLIPALRFIYAGRDSKLAERFNAHREKVVDWLETHCKSTDGYEFPFLQYVVTLSKEKNDPWAALIKHPRHELLFGNARLVVEDGVFTPDPKITFSSSMVLENLPDLTGKRVLDIGTGTGLLAIMASQAGAREVVATDISDAALANAAQNISLNTVENVKLQKSDLTDSVEGKFDAILANIPILDEAWSAQAFKPSQLVDKLLANAPQKLDKGGKIYLPWGSFAEEARPDLEKSLKANGYNFEVKTKDHLGYRWYLYIASKQAE